MPDLIFSEERVVSASAYRVSIRPESRAEISGEGGGPSSFSFAEFRACPHYCHCCVVPAIEVAAFM